MQPPTRDLGWSIAGARSSQHPFEQARPHAPMQQHKRISVVALKHEQIVFAEPAFELHEAAAVRARLAFGNERRCFTAERIDVDVVAAATKPACTGERIALGRNADSAVRLDDLALNAIALPAMASSAAHCRAPPLLLIARARKRPISTATPPLLMVSNCDRTAQ